jgi:hypothetical protein
VIREYLDETYQAPRGEKGFAGPWQSHTKRMLRHKSIIQCGRVAFGFAGIHDDDEAKQISERDMGQVDEVAPVKQPQSRSARAAAPAIERADADGVIDEPVHRERETVQQNDKPAQQKARAKPAQEQFEDAPTTPISDSMLKVLKQKMENNGVNEKDIVKALGVDLDGVTTANYNKVSEYVDNPA